MKMTMLTAVVLAMSVASGSDMAKSLAGEWRVTGKNLSGVVHLPGTLADAKLGRHMTADDWKKDKDRRSKGALTREYQYRGKAVYEREVVLTEKESRYPLELVMERVMLHSELEIDGEALGSRDSLGTEHVYPIPQKLTKAGKHVIRLTLDNSNRYNFSEWSHSYGPVMQSVWHGVVGELVLRRHNPLRNARVFATWPTNGKLVVEVPGMRERGMGSVVFALRRHGCANPAVNLDVSSVKPSPYRMGFKLVELKLGKEPEPWSEHHPNLYVLEFDDGAAVSSKPPYRTSHQIRFGFRSVSAHDRAIWVNGSRWFMRGNLDNCHFPLSGSPDMSVEWWRGTFRRLRDEDGVNAIRFHSWTPPRAAFDAADEEGMCLAVEAGIWVDTWHRSADKMGYGKPIDGYVQKELRAILDEYGNSPSFVSLGIGNELGGSDYNVLSKWIADVKAYDPRRLYIASTARYDRNGAHQRECTADDYYSAAGIGRRRHQFHPYTDWDYEEGYSDLGLPVVAHEIGQWPIYVDWEGELPRYTGVMRPWNLEALRDVAEKSGTRRFWPSFRAASAKLNRLMYKDEVESYMRTPSCSGLQLLGVQDFTGQGEAMVGWRDSFYELKPAVSDLPPFRDVFNSMPHLARFGKYCWSVGETYKATLIVRNITEKPILEGTEFGYSVEAAVAGRPPYRSGSVRLAKTIYPGEVGVIGEVSLPLANDMAGKKFTLNFGNNSWPFWVFGNGRVEHVEHGGCVGVGSRVPRDRAVFETSSLTNALEALAKGGRVLYTGPTAHSATSHFKPVYWSAAHFRQADADLSSLGYVVRSEHPALRGFPTEDWADWQWYNLVEGGVKHGLADLAGTFTRCGRGRAGRASLPCIDPIVQPVPDLHYSTFMGMLFELKVGPGRLMVCGLNLSDETKPEVRAMRASILSYMESEDFDPQ